MPPDQFIPAAEETELIRPLTRWVLGAANAIQTVPSLALFGLLIPVPFIGGIGMRTALVALTLPVPHFFQMSLAVFWLMAFASATHDIAADGFYMLALESGDQAIERSE